MLDTLPPQLLLLCLGVILGLGFLTAFAKTASIGVNDKRLEQMAEENRKAKRLYELQEESPAVLVGSLELFGSFLAILFFVVSVFGFAGRVGDMFALWGMQNSALIELLTVLLLTVVLSFLYQVVYRLVPERLAARYAEGAAIALSGYVKVLVVAGRPFLWPATKMANGIARLFGVRPQDLDEEITEEEIRMLVDIGSESGVIDDDEKEMIHNIFELDDKPVEDIMTHRTEVCLLWLEDSIDQWRDYIDETGHTRYPVCDENIDNVVGTVNSRDFYRFLLNGGQKSGLRSILRTPYFVPDSMKADELFSRMQQNNTHMVVVMDEYGGFQGVVTQKDLLEEIVGELYSEDEEPEEERDIIVLDETTWRILGSAEIEDVEEALDITIPEGDYNTFAGLILDAIETLPEDGEMVETEIGDLQIKVTKVAEHRIEEAVVCLKQEVVIETPEQDVNKAK